MDQNTVLFSANFTGVAALGTYVQMPTIPFRGKIVEIKVVDHKSEPGAKNAEVHVEVVEPAQYAGATRRFTARIPDATEKGQNARRGWRTLLESVGYTPATLESGQPIDIRVANFLNKIGSFMHTAREEGNRDSYDNIEALTPDAYATRLRVQTASGQGGGALPTNAAASLPTASSTPAATSTLRASLLD